MFAVPPGHHPDGGMAPEKVCRQPEQTGKRLSMGSSATGSRNVVFPSPIREKVVYMTWVVNRRHAETRRKVRQPTCPPPGTGLATRKRGAPRAVRSSQVSVLLAGGGRETQNSPPIRKKTGRQRSAWTRNKPAPNRGDVCCPTHSTLQGDLDGRLSKRWHHTRIHGLGGDGFFRGGTGNEGIVPLAPKNARESAHKKPVMVAVGPGDNYQGLTGNPLKRATSRKKRKNGNLPKKEKPVVKIGEPETR